MKRLRFKKEYLLLFLILVLAFWLRLYRIGSPLADWHSWRQADTAAVSRNFIKKGFDLLHPRFDDLSSIASGKENPQGYRFVEFPLYNLIHAGVYKFFPQKSLVWWGRMISIFFSLGATVFLYLIGKKFLGTKVGLLAAFFFTTLPYNIFYSRTVLPEPMMIFTSLAMIYCFAHWVEKEGFLYYLFSILFAALSFLLKPFTLFLVLPLLYLAWRRWKSGILKKPSLYLCLFLSLLPFLAWRVWMRQFPEGIPYYLWLFNDQNIRFKGAFFRWIFAERLGRLILGFWGLIPFVFGILAKPSKKEGWFFYSWLISILAYFTVIAGGNVRHDYYQVISVPIICIFLAKGVNFLLQAPRVFLNRFAVWLVATTCVLFMLAFAWYEVRGYFNINHPEIVEAGLIADKLLPQSAKVIAPYNGDTAFLYQTNRQGWPFVTVSVDYLISRGATHYVSVTFDDLTKSLMEDFRVLEVADNFVIIDLTLRK